MNVFKVIFFHFLMVSSFLQAQENCANVSLKVFKGNEITPYVSDITQLSLQIYREYPYLYEGTEEEYLPFIQRYSESNDGIASILFDDKKLIGVCIGMPLNEMRDNYLGNFSSITKEELDSLYYLGEFLLLKQYRSQGNGKQMYTSFENEVIKKSLYKTLCFCKIQEFLEHPSQPDNYFSMNNFWKQSEYVAREDLSFNVDWVNVNETTLSPHQLYFWFKPLQWLKVFK